jgi:hypothetical protein
VITNTAGGAVPALSVGRARLRFEVVTPLSHRAGLRPDQHDSTKENPTR